MPNEAHALREAASAYLERCRLSVHMVGAHYGLVLDGENRSAVETQNELAATQSNRPLFVEPTPWPPQITASDAVMDSPKRHRYDQLAEVLTAEPLGNGMFELPGHASPGGQVLREVRRASALRLHCVRLF